MFQARGFTLIEVLISMVILSIGLLGLAAMQGISLRDNLDSYNYQQATLLAYEMQDRIKGNNKVNWIDIANADPSYDVGKCVSPNTACTSADMAANDYGYWKKSVQETLPNPTTSTKMVDIKLSDDVNKAGCQGTYSLSICLITTWKRVNNKDSNKASKLSDEAKFYLEVTP